MNYADIHSDIDWWTGTDTSSNSNYPESDRVRRMNQAYREVNQKIWDASSEWEYDDSSFGTLPIATQSLEDGTDNYQLPSSAQSVITASIRDSDGEYHKLTPFDQSQTNQDLEELADAESKGFPSRFNMIGDAIQLVPAPDKDDVTLSEGLRVYLSREINTFTTTSSDTRKPGFIGDFHQLLSLIPSRDYMIANDFNTERINAIQGKINTLSEQLESYYGNRNKYNQGKMIPESLSPGGDGNFNTSV